MKPNAQLVALLRSEVVAVYLAGKIAKEQWRWGFAPSSIDAAAQASASRATFLLPTEIAGMRFTYAGPYTVGCDHACAHGPGTHGAIDRGYCITSQPTRQIVFARSKDGIKKADVVFAWMAGPVDCYGTLVEIGIANALGKPIVLMTPGDLDLKELWFAVESASWCISAPMPSDGLAAALKYARQGVPIEPHHPF